MVSGQAVINAKRQHRHFASTEGSRQHQHFVETGAGLMVNAADEHDVQRRSYPNSFHGNTAGAGWEYVATLGLADHATRVGEEAVQLLGAPAAPSGTADVVIGAQQMSLQIHESAGHALELDRILGDEANFAGTSFIEPDDIGTLKYGSPAVNITSDPTMPGTRGSFAFDDEGTPAQRVRLVEEGIVRATLSNRDSAARSGQQLTGAARSDGWAYLPVCFATHVYLEPGEGSTDELLGSDGRRLLHRRQPQLVHRQPPLELPVRHGGRLRGPRRSTRPAAEELLLRRHHPAVLGFRRGRRRTRGAPGLRLSLRQGGAQAMGLPEPCGRARCSSVT